MVKKQTTEQERKSKVKKPEEEVKEELKDKMENEDGYNVGVVKGEAYDETMSEDEQKKLIDVVMKELKFSEDSLSTILAEYPDVKKAYLDNEKNPDPFYVDYNLLFNNVDMLMALSYANEMKAIFSGTNSADFANADIITKTAEYEYREEMDMDLTEYELLIDKFIGGVGAVVREWNEETNSAIPKCGPLQYFRPDPLGRGHEKNYRRLGWYGRMTKVQMKQAGNYFNIDNLVTTKRDKTDNSDRNNNGSNVSLQDENSNDESAYFDIFNQFRTDEEGRKRLITLSDGGKTIIRAIKLEYKIGSRRVFPVSLDFWKPKPGYPMGIRLYDLGSRKQKVLSLLLNLAVKKAVKSSLGNHIIVDEEAVKNKNQLRQLTEFPEIILVDTKGGAKSLNNIVSELNHSQVPQDNYNTDERLKQLNYEETSIGPNQLGISPTGNQTATEIKDNATNSNVRLSLSNRVSMIFWKDFNQKWFMMHVYHFPEDAKKLVTVSREFGDRYLTFERKYLDMSSDPHIKIISKFDLEQKNAKLFANHVILHSYVVQLSSQPYVPLSVRLSMRKAYRQLGYEEDEIDDYIEESAEEREAKSQLYMLNRNEKLEKLSPEQIDEHHEDYLHVYKQAKVNEATKAAIADRIRMQKARDMQNRKAAQQQQGQNPQEGGVNQQTASVLNQNGQKTPTLQDIKM